ncbi:phage portal protein [Tropicimonas sp. IMCC34043]|uniref:phage portal protein n=1 Tax=Tropicimonas sp. IMCC34043 TaxID=2248760 RepID=UPI000E27A371|nr:phage portal protein [Tropicimonas sp. IMCC34043]
MAYQTNLLGPDGRPLRAAAPAPRPRAQYLRDTRSGVIASRAASLVPSRDEIRRVWSRTSTLALDMIQNSGQLKGAVDQVMADTVGVGLTLTPMPDLAALGYSREQAAEWIRNVRQRWERWSRTPEECDARGRLTVAQMVDISLRWNIAYGEALAMFDFFGTAQRRRYGIETGTKVRMITPSRLVQDTNYSERLFQGVRHDEIGRRLSYRFEVWDRGVRSVKDFAAFDSDARPAVVHVFDPVDADDVRGISQLVSAFRKYLQAEILDDSTLQMAILQTIFAITLTSDAPSQDAFEALQALSDSGDKGRALSEEFVAYMGSKLDAAASSRISVGADPQVSHLGPGEDLSLKGASVPGPEYLPFRSSMDREVARAIGITYGAFTMNNSDATYSSVRMDVASIWPVVMRRRERVAAPICQPIYANWLDEEIGEGRIPLRGGYAAFRAHRAAITRAQWQGPPRPTADDKKTAQAASERLRNGTSSIEIETGDLGTDADTLFEQRQQEHRRYVEAGMASPYDATAGGSQQIEMVAP